jgi:hypothetical protein
LGHPARLPGEEKGEPERRDVHPLSPQEAGQWPLFSRTTRPPGPSRKSKKALASAGSLALLRTA